MASTASSSSGNQLTRRFTGPVIGRTPADARLPGQRALGAHDQFAELARRAASAGGVGHVIGVTPSASAGAFGHGDGKGRSALHHRQVHQIVAHVGGCAGSTAESASRASKAASLSSTPCCDVAMPRLRARAPRCRAAAGDDGGATPVSCSIFMPMSVADIEGLHFLAGGRRRTGRRRSARRPRRIPSGARRGRATSIGRYRGRGVVIRPLWRGTGRACSGRRAGGHRRRPPAAALTLWRSMISHRFDRERVRAMVRGLRGHDLVDPAPCAGRSGRAARRRSPSVKMPTTTMPSESIQHRGHAHAPCATFPAARRSAWRFGRHPLGRGLAACA